MSTTLIRVATFQLSNSPVVPARLGGGHSRPKAHFRLWKCRESNPTNPSANEPVFHNLKATYTFMFLTVQHILVKKKEEDKKTEPRPQRLSANILCGTHTHEIKTYHVVDNGNRISFQFQADQERGSC